MVAIVKVPVADFSPERFDTGFYSQEFYAARAQIQKSGLSLEPIGAVCEPWQFGAYALCSDIVWSSEQDGIPFIKAEAIESPLINDSALSYVTKATHSLLSKSALKAGDIIMSTSGTVGRLAVLPDAIPFANSNQDTIKFSLSGTTYDSHFVAAWLTSVYAQAFMNREAGGAVQQHIYLYNFRRLPLLKLSPNVQKYIGDRIRQAEMLRGWAKSVVMSLDTFFATQYLPLSQYKKYKSSFFKMDMQSTFDVLTPESYPPEIEQYFRENEFLTLGQLSSDIFTGNTQNDANGVSDAVFQATSRSCSGLFLRQPFNQVLRPRKGKYLRKMDILLTCGAHDKKYIGRDVSIYHDDQENLPSSKVLVVRVKENTLPAAYVHSYLKSNAGYVQWQSVVRGISAGIHPVDVARIRIPIPKRTKEWEVVQLVADERIGLAGKACEVSNQLTDCAKFLVEGLVEGQITESELIAAEHALQTGNDQLDRSILSRLKIDGVDGKGQPLFSDLDELYRLLAQASQD